MFNSIQIGRQTIQRAVAYLPPTMLLLYGLIIMFFPLNFPTGIEFLFGNTEADYTFGPASYAILVAVLLFDAVRNHREKTLAVAGAVVLFNSLPRLLYRFQSNYGKGLFVVAVLLMLSSFIVSREK